MAYTLLFLLCAVAQASPLVKVPGGYLEPFLREERPNIPTAQSRKTSIKALEAQEHAVTNEEFLAFLKKRPEWRKENIAPIFAEESYLSQFGEGLSLNKGVRRRAPVTFVSWFAAKAYCEWLGLRLPTTDEWEYLATASETKREASREPAFLRRILEWYALPRTGELAPVESTYKNYYGLYDMHGLIWEWVEDFSSNLASEEGRGQATADRNLFCGAGGASGANKENYAAFMRFAFRSSMKGKGSVWNLGFRCVR